MELKKKCLKKFIQGLEGGVFSLDLCGSGSMFRINLVALAGRIVAASGPPVTYVPLELGLTLVAECGQGIGERDSTPLNCALSVPPKMWAMSAFVDGGEHNATARRVNSTFCECDLPKADAEALSLIHI